jgi:hypothetical protein
MAEVNKIDTLAKLLEAYGAGVRAGVLTPCLEDENEFRAMLGLSAASPAVEQAWKAQGGTRAPVTLQRTKKLEEATPEKNQQGDAANEANSRTDEQ